MDAITRLHRLAPLSTFAEKCQVRGPRPTDCARMAALATQLGYPCRAEDIQRRIAGMTDSERFAIYVAEDSREVVIGWIGAYVFRSVEVDKIAEISGLIVDEEARGHGVGEKLLLAVEEWARTIGCRLISVRSNVVRERAHQFYLRHSYEVTKTQKSFVKPLAEP